ncbi:MAG: UTRA domain-containing protein [Streptomycetaceae bacterium]|nr:UTRA domain-containing protein [Streptomycetaceae bacterium]
MPVAPTRNQQVDGAKAQVRACLFLGLAVSAAICQHSGYALTAAEARLLGLAPGAPAFLVERPRFDEAERPVQAADLVFPADRWRIAF